MKATQNKPIAAAIVGAICIAALMVGLFAMTSCSKQSSIADGSLRVDGSKLTVELDSDSDSGNAWFSDATGNATVVADQRYEEEESSENSDKTIFTYVGIEKGSTEITLTYKESWEDENPEKALVITVNTDYDGNIKSVQGTGIDGSAINL